MKTLTAFLRKELLELQRTGKLLLLVIISVLFGIMNPLIAKITPWMLEMLSSDLAEMGMNLTSFEVDVMTSWTQFYKNVPLLLLIFVVIMSGILTNEYQKGTLVNILTKGLERWKVVVAKLITMIGLWSLCYVICFVITYLYNIYFWSHQSVPYMMTGAICLYLLGVWVISLIILFSCLFDSNSSTLALTGGFFIVVYLISFIPHIQSYLPTQLLNSMMLLTGELQLSDFMYSIVITSVTSVIGIILGILFFNKKAV